MMASLYQLASSVRIVIEEDGGAGIRLFVSIGIGSSTVRWTTIRARVPTILRAIVGTPLPSRWPNTCVSQSSIHEAVCHKNRADFARIMHRKRGGRHAFDAWKIA